MLVSLIPLAASLAPPAHAHAVNIASLELAEQDGGWTLSLSAPEAAIDRALCETHGVVVVAAMDDRAWKEAAVAWVKAGVSLTVAGEALPLGAGGIRRDGHETRLRLAVPAVDSGDPVEVHADALVDGQVYVARLRTASGQARVVLDEKAGWSGTLVPGA